MVIGLYTAKYPFRKLISFLLPLFRNTNPNLISWGLTPIGILTAYNYYLAFETNNPWLYLLGLVLIFVRLVIATLDGLVAVTYNKSSVMGDFVNRLTPEICDWILFPVLALTEIQHPLIVIFSLTASWAISYSGLVGTASGLPVQSTGPVGQTDRLAALMLFSFLQFLSLKFNWGIDFIYYFLYWVFVGGIITVGLRNYKHLQLIMKNSNEKH